MSMKCQGKSDICQGKVREMSGNFDTAGALEPCLGSIQAMPQACHYLPDL